MEENSIEVVLCEIRNTCGMDILADGRRLVAAFYDFSQEKGDQRLLRYFVEAGGHTAFLSVRDMSPVMQHTIEKLCTEMMVSEEASQKVCYAFWAAAHGTTAVPPKSRPRTTRGNTDTASVKCRSVPARKSVEVDPDLEIIGEVVIRYKGNKPHVQIPEGIVSIGEKAFFANETLNSVLFPESLENIGANAFFGTQLQTMVLPRRLNYVADAAFGLCRKLEKVEFTHMPVKLDLGIFHNCESLQEVIFPEGAEEIDLDIFNIFGATIRVYIPDSARFVHCFSIKDRKALEIVASSKWISDHQNLFQSNPKWIPVPSGKQPKPEERSYCNKAKDLYYIAKEYYSNWNTGSLALQYFSQSAQMDYADAQNMMGIFYERGITRGNQILVQKDEKTAIQYYMAAAKEGNPHAQNAVASYYNRNGNYAEAVFWARRAAKQDAANSEPALAYHLKCFGTEESLAEALSIYLKYAQLNSLSYHDYVADFYENGWGTSRDLLQAARWKNYSYWDGTEEGDTKVLFDEGDSCSFFAHENQEKLYLAFEYFMEAAKRGSADGQFRVGDAYEYGYGVPVNLQEAAMWYHKAAEQNHKAACRKLSVMYAKGNGVPWNPIESRKWKKKAGY